MKSLFFFMEPHSQAIIKINLRNAWLSVHLINWNINKEQHV